jgi:hypothetical protein
MTNGTTSQLLTPEQFAARVRAKYRGAYDDLSDADLTQGTRGPLNTVATMGAAAGGPSTSRAAASTSRR